MRLRGIADKGSQSKVADLYNTRATVDENVVAFKIPVNYRGLMAMKINQAL